MTTPLRRMTPRQKRFIEEYLVDLNGVQAAIRAGYGRDSSNSMGSRILKKPHIAAALEEAVAARAQRTGITADQVLREYARIAFADIRKFTEKNGDSGARQFKQLDDLSDDEAAAIVEFSTDGEGRTAKIKLHDKKKALEALARHLGLFAARREQSRNPSASARELRELLERRFARILKPEGSADGNRQHASVLRALRRGLVASDRFTNSSILRLDQCLLEHLGLTQCTWISMRPFAKLIILW